MKIGDFVEVLNGKEIYIGTKGCIIGITGSIKPFHYIINIAGISGEYVFRGDELKIVEE